VNTEDAASGKKIMTKLVQATAAAPCICTAYSESVELDAEIRQLAEARRDEINTNSNTLFYHPLMDLKMVEDRIRSQPEMQKRIAAARGMYDLKYRVDRAYRKIVLSWSELKGYSKPDGQFESERALAQASFPNVAKPAPGALITARIHMEPLQPGTYRVRIEGESLAGGTSKIDERIYWFDGKTFEEM
jgi:hypothetical protein